MIQESDERRSAGGLSEQNKWTINKMARRFQSQEHKPEFNSIPDSSLFNSPLLIPQNRQMSSLRQLLAKMQEFPVSLVFDWKKSGVALDATPRAQKERQAMKKTLTHDERIAKLTFTAVYPYLLAKVEKKNRTKAELHSLQALRPGTCCAYNPATSTRSPCMTR